MGKRYVVSMPITGMCTVEVDADSKDQAIEAFYDVVDKMTPEEINEVTEWEFIEKIADGNVIHTYYTDVSVSLIKGKKNA